MEAIHLVRKKVYDPFLRLMHLLLGSSVIGLMITGWLANYEEPGPETAWLWDVHIKLGYLFTVTMVARLFWFFLGPEFAQWHNFFHVSIWWKVLRQKSFPKISSSFGHDPMASIAYLTFYGMTILSIVSGFFLAGIEHAHGPLANSFFDSTELSIYFRWPHLSVAIGMAGFILIHILALTIKEKTQKLPLTQAMFSGYQYRHPLPHLEVRKNEMKKNHKNPNEMKKNNLQEGESL